MADLEMSDFNEILSQYGIDNVQPSATVLQSNGNIINIPNRPLQPPVLTDSIADNITDATIEEPLENAEIEISEVAEAMETYLPEHINESDSLQEILESPETSIDSIDSIVSNTVDSQSNEEETVEEEEEEEEEDEVNEENPLQIENNDLATNDGLYNLLVNPKSIEAIEVTSRFSGAEWFKAIQTKEILLAGLGGIGSNALFCLSRVHPQEIIVMDNDVIEAANLSGQLYSVDMIGIKKADAMSMIASNFSCYNRVVSLNRRFTLDDVPRDIMICGFDNMDARKTFFNRWLYGVSLKRIEERKDCLFIDGRLSMESFQVFCITGDDKFNIERYKREYLFSDYDVSEDVCSMKQTTFCSTMIGSVITNLFVNFVANSLSPVIPRQLPFKTFYDASLMYFKTES